MILQRESPGAKLERMLHIFIMTTATWRLVNVGLFFFLSIPITSLKLSVMENLEIPAYSPSPGKVLNNQKGVGISLIF